MIETGGERVTQRESMRVETVDGPVELDAAVGAAHSSLVLDPPACARRVQALLAPGGVVSVESPDDSSAWRTGTRARQAGPALAGPGHTTCVVARRSPEWDQ